MNIKNYSIIILLIFLSIPIFSQNEFDFSKFDKKGMKTNLLLTSGSPFSILGQNNTTFGMYGFMQSYKDLSLSDNNNFKNLQLLQNTINEVQEHEQISIGLIHTDFEIISKKAFDQGKIILKNKAFYRNSNQYVFDQYSETILAPLTLRKVGLQTKFILNNNFVVQTAKNKISSIFIDFNDNKGFVKAEIDKLITVNYQSEGQKTITYKIIFENKSQTIKQSKITINYSNSDLNRLFQRAPTLLTATRQPDLAMYGVTDNSVGKCEYEIFLSPDGILDKPIFLVDGFDPGNTRNTTAVYSLLNYTNAQNVTQNLGDRIRNEENFDVIIINFPAYTNAANNLIDGGADFIERNALSVVNVIELINAQKVGNEKNVVLGPSMGGLITRFALKYMEINNLNHDTRLWVSIDSPHYGANVSIGLQHIFNYFAYGIANSDAVKPLVNGTLRSAAAKQMLVDHFDAHTTSIAGVSNPTVPTTGLPLTPTGFANYRNNFQNRMNTMGFPQTTRNVCIANGSGVGALFNSLQNTPVSPGFELINSNIATGQVSGLNTRAVTTCKFMPNANVNFELAKVQVQAQIVFWFTQDTFTARATQSANTNGVDSAPGGLFDILALGGSLGNDPILSNFIGAMRAGFFNFIPVTSAMGLNFGGNIATNQPNYYHTFNLGAKDTPWDNITTPTTNTTPFVNWFMPATNETHVKLTQNNTEFVWCEIVKPDFSFNTTSNLISNLCIGTSASYSFNFNSIKSCLPLPVNFSVTGLPNTATVLLTPNTLSANGTLNLNVSGLSAGTYNFSVVPTGYSTKTINITLTVNPVNPNLANTIQYNLNNSTFITANTVTVPNGANIELQLPSSLYNGTIEWFNPLGMSVGSTNPVIANIVDGSSNEGTWNAVVSFTNDCARMAPSSIPITINVDPPLSIDNFTNKLFSVFPNPALEYLTLKSSENLQNSTLEIFDLRGRLLQKNKIFNWKNEYKIDFSKYQSGTYFISIETQNQQKLVKKIIKI